MVNMNPFLQPVHRSLLQREMLGGIPQAGLLLLVFLGVIFIYGLRINFMLIPIILLYFIMRRLTKADQWCIDIILDNVMQKETLIP